MLRCAPRFFRLSFISGPSRRPPFLKRRCRFIDSLKPFGLSFQIYETKIFTVILVNSSNSMVIWWKMEYFSMKITSNEVSLKRLSLNFMSEHIENWNEFRREENLLLVKIGRWIYFLLCYFARATIKSWQRRRSGSTGMADVQENKAKIRDNEYVVTDACLLNLYARRLFKLFLMASHEMPRP